MNLSIVFVARLQGRLNACEAFVQAHLEPTICDASWDARLRRWYVEIELAEIRPDTEPPSRAIINCELAVPYSDDPHSEATITLALDVVLRTLGLAQAPSVGVST